MPNRVNFKMVGKLTLPKSTDSFKPYEEKETSKGNGKMFNLSFNCQMTNKSGKANGNQHMLRLSEYVPNDTSNKIVYAYMNDGWDDKNRRWSGHSERIAWAKRNDKNITDKVANFAKHVVDLEEPSVRRAIRNIERALIDGKEPLESDLKAAQITDVNNMDEAIKKSNNKRKEFITQYDLIQFIYKLLTDEKLSKVFGDRLFLVEGEHEFSYSSQNNRWYENFVPSKIYLQAKDAESYAREDVVVYYGSDSLNDTLDEIGKYTVSGWTQIKEKYSGDMMFAPYTLTVLKTRTGNTEQDDKVDKIRMKRFNVDDDDSIRCMGVVVNLFNGTELLDITEDDLTEEQQESILMGDCTLEDIQRELGGKRSERKTENRFFKLMSGYSNGVQETVYTRDMMNNVKEEEDYNQFEEEPATESKSDDIDDIFDDFDDLL